MVKFFQIKCPDNTGRLVIQSDAVFFHADDAKTLVSREGGNWDWRIKILYELLNQAEHSKTERDRWLTSQQILGLHRKPVKKGSVVAEIRKLREFLGDFGFPPNCIDNKEANKKIEQPSRYFWTLDAHSFSPQMTDEEVIQSSEQYWEILDEYANAPELASKGKSKPLSELQRDVFAWFDDLNISSVDDFKGLREEEQHSLEFQLIERLAGLDQDPNNLLHLDFFNTRFLHEEVFLHARDPVDLEVLHCKSAIFSDHAIVEVGSVRIMKDDSITGRGHLSLPPELLMHLFLHRPLISSGKLSLVPRTVSRMVEGQDQPQQIFAVEMLETISVELGNDTIRETYLDEGRENSALGILLLKTTQGSRVPIEEILEIQDHFRLEFGHFQTKLRESIEYLNPQNHTKRVKNALRTVERELRFLDDKYNQVRKNLLKSNDPHQGYLGIGLYGQDHQDESFVRDALSQLGTDSLVQFIPWSKSLPLAFRHHPYFVPWLIHRKSSIKYE